MYTYAVAEISGAARAAKLLVGAMAMVVVDLDAFDFALFGVRALHGLCVRSAAAGPVVC